MEKTHDWLSVSNCSLLCFVLLLFSGMFTQPLERITPPYGYLYRFLAYTALTFVSVRFLTKKEGLTLECCRITKVRLHPLGILFAVFLPIIMILWKIHGEPGHFAYNQMSTEQSLEIMFYLMFHTGFCKHLFFYDGNQYLFHGSYL